MADIPAHLYDLDGSSGHASALQADYAARSNSALGLADAQLDLAYGSHERHVLDVFSAGPDAPVLAFFHGGYWKAGSKNSRRFPALSWVPRGVSWVCVNYRLVPEHRLEDAVNDARAAVSWLSRNAPDLKLNADALHVCGNSAGGHLGAMVAAEGWEGRPMIKSATLVSGLFELAPLREAGANDWLELDATRARDLSPICHLPPREMPVLLAVGGAETAAFKHQSKVYAEHLSARGNPMASIEAADQDHFEVIGDFGDPTSDLFANMRQMIDA